MTTHRRYLLKSLILILLILPGGLSIASGASTLYVTVESEKSEGLTAGEWEGMFRVAQEAGLSDASVKAIEGWGDLTGKSTNLRASEEGYPALGRRDSDSLILWVLNPTESARELVVTFPAERGITSMGFTLEGNAPEVSLSGKGHAYSRRKNGAMRCHLPAKSVLIFRASNHLPLARMHLNTLYQWSRRASSSTRTRQRWLAACNEVSRNLDAVGRLLGSTRRERTARHLHRALLASAQIDMMGRNLQSRLSDSDAKEPREALLGLRESLAAMSGIVLDVRASMRVESQGDEKQVRVTLTNQGVRSVQWLTFRLKAPQGWRISPAGGIPHPRIQPGQSMSATFQVTPSGDPKPEEILEGDISYFFANSAVHLKVCRPARPREGS